LGGIFENKLFCREQRNVTKIIREIGGGGKNPCSKKTAGKTKKVAEEEAAVVNPESSSEAALNDESSINVALAEKNRSKGKPNKKTRSKDTPPATTNGQYQHGSGY
jgi:hypothetical protein